MKDTLILAIESSCDETAAAVVKNGRTVLSNVISSQIAMHTLYGGVVPELASRKHIEKINQVITQALTDADMTLDEFREAQARKGESIAGLMLKSVLSSLVEKTGTNRAGEFGLMADFLAGNKTGLKNKLMGMMANAPNGLENTVILEGRNAKCMEVFDRWSGKGVRRIGVFYGAAHLPGLHGALLERGYRLREVRWLPAWSTREQGADG